MRLIINTDGGARGNPGPAGIGFTIRDESGALLREGGAYVGETTNNWAEYEALVRALGELKKIVAKEKRAGTRIEVRMDSELAVKQLMGVYQVKDEPLQLQFMKIWNLRVSEFPDITFAHIPREENAAADRLVNAAIDAAQQGEKELF
jgi:ribonuclease HI